MKTIPLASLVVSFIALVVAFVAISRVGAHAELDARLEATVARVEGLEGRANARLSDLEELSGRLVQVAAAVAEDRAGPSRADATPSEETLARMVRAATLRELGHRELTATEVPRPVGSAVARLVPGLAIARARQLARGGGRVFELIVRSEGAEYALTIDRTGKVIEAELPVRFAPRAVAGALERFVPGAEIRWVTLTGERIGTAYELGYSAGDEEHDARLAADGEVLEISLPVAHAPREAISAAAQQVPGIEARRVLRRLDEAGEVTFGVEGRAGAHAYEVWMTKACEVFEVSMPYARLSDTVKAAARAQVEGLRPWPRAWRLIEDGETLFVVEGEAGGREYELVITPHGEVVEMERGEAFGGNVPAREPPDEGQHERPPGTPMPQGRRIDEGLDATIF